MEGKLYLLPSKVGTHGRQPMHAASCLTRDQMTPGVPFAQLDRAFSQLVVLVAAVFVSEEGGAYCCTPSRLTHGKN